MTWANMARDRHTGRSGHGQCLECNEPLERVSLQRRQPVLAQSPTGTAMGTGGHPQQQGGRHNTGRTRIQREGGHHDITWTWQVYAMHWGQKLPRGTHSIPWSVSLNSYHTFPRGRERQQERERETMVGAHSITRTHRILSATRREKSVPLSDAKRLSSRPLPRPVANRCQSRPQLVVHTLSP